MLLFAPAGFCAEGNARLPRAEAVLQKAIERARWVEQQKLVAKYTYTQRNAIDDLDSEDGVKKHEERLHLVVPIDGEPYSRLIQKDGRPLSAKEVRQEQDRERKFRSLLAEKRRKREQGKRNDEDMAFDEELVNRYHFDLAGRETVNGRPAFLFRFEPKSHDLPVKRKLDRLLNKLAGRLWIDEQDYEISRVDVHLTENVSAWGGVLASVRKFILQFEQTKVDEVAWLPSSADAYVDGRILIKSLHLRVKQQNSDFRKIAPEAGQPASSRD